MRKHPLIALFAFAFLAIATFIGASGAAGLNSVPVRATSHLKSEKVSSKSLHAADLRWLAAVSREHAAVLAFSAVLAGERYSPLWRGRAADLVAIHDGTRPLNALLPSAWRAVRLRAVRAAAARAAAAHAYAVAQAAVAQAQAEAAAQAQQPPPAVVSPPPPKSSGNGELGGVWLQLRLCESGNNYQENTGNGYYGAYQFSLSTWEAIGYSGLPSNASPAVQDQAAEKLQALAGWGQWPACSAELGL